MKANRGDVEEPADRHATLTRVPTEVASFASPHLDRVPLNPVYEDKLTGPADIAFCRVCWEENSDPLQNLVQPCLCRGSQANIHLSCLRAWQRVVMDNGVTVGDERAFRCGVCKATYAIPPEPRSRYKHTCLQVIRLALVMASSFTLYCGIDNAYMWPMLGFIALVLPMSDRGARAAICLSILLIIVVLRFLVPYSEIKSLVTMMAEGASSFVVGSVLVVVSVMAAEHGARVKCRLTRSLAHLLSVALFSIGGYYRGRCAWVPEIAVWRGPKAGDTLVGERQ